jgi:hypothetical protein
MEVKETKNRNGIFKTFFMVLYTNSVKSVDIKFLLLLCDEFQSFKVMGKQEEKHKEMLNACS